MESTKLHIILGMSFGGGIVAIIFAILTWHFLVPKKFLNYKSKEDNNKGEKIIRDIKFWCKKSKFIFIPPTMLGSHSTKPFKTDGIIITNRVIMVIKTECYSKIITSSMKNENWQVLMKDSEQNFPNPIKLNDEIITKVQSIISLSTSILSLIIFVNNYDEINVDGKPPHVVLTNSEKLFFSLKQTIAALESFPIFSKEHTDSMYFNLVSNSLKGRKLKKILKWHNNNDSNSMFQTLQHKKNKIPKSWGKIGK